MLRRSTRLQQQQQQQQQHVRVRGRPVLNPEIEYNGTQPENVCQACFKSKKYCYRYDGHDNICAFCHSSHSRCVRELSGGAVTAPPLYVSKVVHNYFVNHREDISTLDNLARDNTAADAVSSRTRYGHRRHPAAPLQLIDEDEDLQLQYGVKRNLNEFRVLSLHELQDENLEVGSQNSSVRGYHHQPDADHSSDTASMLDVDLDLPVVLARGENSEEDQDQPIQLEQLPGRIFTVNPANIIIDGGDLNCLLGGDGLLRIQLRRL